MDNRLRSKGTNICACQVESPLGCFKNHETIVHKAGVDEAA